MKNTKNLFIGIAVLGIAAIGYYYYDKKKKEVKSNAAGGGMSRMGSLPPCPGSQYVGCTCSDGHWGTYYDGTSGKYVCKCFGNLICGSPTGG